MAATRGEWLRSAGMIAAIYICPVVLVATGVIPFQWRFHVLILMTLLAGSLALFRRHSAISLGLVLPRFWPLMGWSVIPPVILTAAVTLSDLPHRQPTPGHLAFYVFFVFVLAPAQEFLYRSFLFAELRKIRIPPNAIVLASTVLFGFMHIIYKDLVTVLLTLAAGLIWSIVFNRTRKVYMVAASHAALGVAAILSGVI